MTRTLLIRGMLVGLVAGVLAIIFAKIFGEPEVNLAIAFENAQNTAAGEPPDTELVSRAVQTTLGLATAVSAYAVAYGGVFALAFAFASGRIGRFGPRATAGLLALAGFVTVQLVPFVKYPANPPSVGQPDTLGHRTALYFVMIAISVLLGFAALSVGRQLAPRFGSWNASLMAIGAFVAAVAVAQLLLPDVSEVPVNFPAVVLWRFRLAALGTQVVLWATFGLLFGALTERSLHRTPQALTAMTTPA